MLTLITTVFVILCWVTFQWRNDFSTVFLFRWPFYSLSIYTIGESAFALPCVKVASKQLTAVDSAIAMHQNVKLLKEATE